MLATNAGNLQGRHQDARSDDENTDEVMKCIMIDIEFAFETAPPQHR